MDGDFVVLQVGDTFYILLDGEVEVSVTAEDGSRTRES
jgi:hypothetical protein